MQTRTWVKVDLIFQQLWCFPIHPSGKICWIISLVCLPINIYWLERSSFYSAYQFLIKWLSAQHRQNKLFNYELSTTKKIIRKLNLFHRMFLLSSKSCLWTSDSYWLNWYVYLEMASNNVSRITRTNYLAGNEERDTESIQRKEMKY